MKANIKSIYFIEIFVVLCSLFVLLVLDSTKILSPTYIRYATEIDTYIFILIFTILLYLLSILSYKQILKRQFSKHRFSNLIIILLIFTFVGYIASALSYILTDSIFKGFDKAFAIYVSIPKLFLVALATPFLPLYTWLGGTINGALLIFIGGKELEGSI